MFQLFVIRSLKHRATIRDKKGDEIGHSSPFLYFIQTVFSGLDPRSDRTKEGNGNNRIFCEVSE